MGKGKGKGKKPAGIRGFDGNIRVWIGGLPQKGPAEEKEANKELNMKLKQHMSSTGLECLYAEVGRGGQGGAAFKTEEMATQAIAVLNGSVFEGMVIQVDKLTKGNPKATA